MSRFSIDHYEGDPADGITAFDSDPEWPWELEIGDEARALALVEALAAHLGLRLVPADAEVAPAGLLHRVDEWMRSVWQRFDHAGAMNATQLIERDRYRTVRAAVHDAIAKLERAALQEGAEP